MMQAPMPPPLPGLDPNLVFNEVVPIIAAVVVIGAVAVALRWIFRTPVGEAIAERIRTRAQRRWGAESEDPERVAALEAQVSHLQGQISELAERIDFAERMLAERRERKLGAGQGRPASTPRVLMGIFERLSTLIRANINDLINRAGDPEKKRNQRDRHNPN